MKKKLLLISIVCLFSLSLFAKEKRLYDPIYRVDTLPTVQLITFLQQMNVDSFYGHSVDSFLSVLPANFYNQKIYGGSHSHGAHFRASYLSLYFTPDIYGPGVNIYVHDYTHMTRYSPMATWNIALFRQEKIYKIEVWKDQNTCINGSCK
jgi:hypothetical protein